MKKADRELCLAQKKGEEPCLNPASECQRHCGAEGRKNGKYCAVSPMPNGRCWRHGGNSLAGVAHPNFKTGERSRYVYDRLQSKYEENLKDARITELADEISFLRAMVQDLLDRWESGKQWRDALAAYKPVKLAERRLMRSIRANDASGMMQALEALEPAMEALSDVLKEGAHDAAVRDELVDRIERVRKLADSEHKHRIDHRMALTQEQVANHVAAVLGVITRHVTDRNTLNAISRDLRALDEPV